jgi:hypothetical protein
MTCTCKDCERTRLNPEPSETQMNAFRRHLEEGTSPGNPKWYHVPKVVKRAEFVPGQPAKFPAWTNAWDLGHDQEGDRKTDRRDDVVFSGLTAEMPTAEYVKLFEAACHLGTPEQPKAKRKRASKKPYRVERKRFATLDEAKAYAHRIYERTGSIVAIEQAA